MDDVQHLRELLDERTRSVRREIDALVVHLDERYATQTKALDAAFVAADKAVRAALASAEKAVTKAEVAATERADAHNGLLQKMETQGTTFMPRSEYAANHNALQKQVDDLVDTLRRMEGHAKGALSQRASIFATVGIGVSVLLAVLALLTFGN